LSTWSERALQAFPAGSNGEFDIPDGRNVVIERGKGCEVWDASGRRYLDLSMGWGSALVGHAREEVVGAVARRAALGSNFSCVTTESVELAEEILRVSPACKRLRFCASGTEATLYCIRLARAFTGRPKILKFEGAYHGAHALGVTSLFPSRPPAYPAPDPSCAGIEALVRDSVLVAPYNDLEASRRLIVEHAPELAAVIVEPLQRCTSPLPGFLAGLRESTRSHGVLLIFDEVVTGFRLALGGAQEYYGVVPDLVAYGKALGGGYPIGAFGGSSEIVDQAREDRLGTDRYVWTASTLGGNPVSCAAARAALRVLAAPGSYSKLRSLGERLRAGLRDRLQAAGERGQVIGDGPLAQIVLSTEPVVDYRSLRKGDAKRQRRIMLELLDRGVFLNPMGTKLYLSLAHDDAACDELAEKFGDALAATR
jgi:glutamate-1-semialdehyde 2,1-aminomutase